MQRITILGSTGTIGINTLSVIDQHPDKFLVEALAAHSNVEILFAQCQKYSPQHAVLVDLVAANELVKRLRDIGSRTEVHAGQEALIAISSDTASQIVVAGIVGSAGLIPTLAAIRAGKRVLLANKEPLVMAGFLFMEEVRKSHAQLVPVDSEHNAIFQCFPHGFWPGNGCSEIIDSIVLTASGGPFRLTPIAELNVITPEQAVAHPNWKMGAKISVDCATMMNKGLEVIEACWLFELPLEKINVVIHPQSVIHSFVRYCDGSTLAQLSYPDMRVPIATALAWPNRIFSGIAPLNVLDYSSFNFEAISFERYPCLKLAFDAFKAGGTSMCILNAANEVAVQAFLQRKIAFRHIHELVQEVLNKIAAVPAATLEIVQEADRYAREVTKSGLKTLSTKLFEV